MTDPKAVLQAVRRDNPVQNLSNLVPKEKNKRSRGFYASTALDAFAVLAAAATSWLYRQYMDGAGSLAPVVIALFVVSLASLFCLLLTKSMLRRAAVLALQTAGLLAFFLDLAPSLLLTALIAGFLIFWWGERQSRTHIENNLEMKFVPAVKPALGKFITAATVIAVILYIPQWTAHGFISPSGFETMYASSVGGVQYFYPDIRLTGSVQAFAESVVLSKLKAMPGFRTAPPEMQARQVSESAQQIIAELSKQTGLEIRPEQSMVSFFYGVTSAALTKWQKDLGGKLVYLWAIGAFLVVRSFGFIFYFVAMLAGVGLYQLLLGLEAIKITGESRMKEMVHW